MLAPAKLNLSLAVGPPRLDGRHPVASLMVPLAFGDDIDVDPTDHDTLDRGYADDAPGRRPPLDWPAAQDLARRAQRTLERHTGRTLPCRIDIRKRVPPGSGLAGGSADAAAVLHRLDTAYDLGLPASELEMLAAGLGADVAFCLRTLREGPGPMLATGDGSRLEPVPEGDADLHAAVALIFPPFGCGTAAVYAALDAAEAFGDPADTGRVLRERFNDLEAPAAAVAPELGALLHTLRDAGLPVHLTGSGSTLFLEAPDLAHAHHLARHVHRLTALPTLAAAVLT